MRKLTLLHLGVAALVLSLNFANAGGLFKGGGGGGGGVFQGNGGGGFFHGNGGGGFFHKKAVCGPAYYAETVPGPNTCYEPQVQGRQLFVVQEGGCGGGQIAPGYYGSQQVAVGQAIQGNYCGTRRLTRAQLDPRIPHYYNGQLIPLTADGYVISWPGEENIPWVGDQPAQPAPAPAPVTAPAPATQPANPPPPPHVQPDTVTPPPAPAPQPGGERLTPRQLNRGTGTPGLLPRRTPTTP